VVRTNYTGLPVDSIGSFRAAHLIGSVVFNVPAMRQLLAGVGKQVEKCYKVTIVLIPAFHTTML